MTSIRNLALIGLAAAATAVAPTAAIAKDGDVTRTARCSSGSTIKLKLSPDDGRLETEVEVDQNRNGVRWRVSLRRNGRVAASTQATTRGPSGSFEISRRLPNAAGRDRVTARATSPSGETCLVTASI